MPAAARARALTRPQIACVRAWGGAAAVGLALLVVALGVGGRGFDRFADRWVYDSLELLAAVGCLARAWWVRAERGAWALLGLAVLSFSIGDLLFDFLYADNPPIPSAADVFYLAFYPGCYTALLLLVRSRIAAFNASVWLDGVIAALATAAVASAVVFRVVLDSTHGAPLTVIVELAYPLGDVLLLGLVVFAFALTGWRPGRQWALLGAGFVAITFADSMYLDLTATGAYHPGTLLDAVWPASLLLLAASGWQKQHGRARRVELEGRFLGAVPIGCGAVALTVLVIDSRVKHLDLLTVGLAAATVATVLVRTWVSFRENRLLLDAAKEQSLTDPLTLLGNRRKLMLDLNRALPAQAAAPLLLVILDLNGFKQYNDTFGHPSGDRLLARLADKLAHAAAPRGDAYRLGGDEFCILAPFTSDAETLIHAAAEALAEDGEGFSVTAAFGAVVLPDEASETSEALRIADQRLYAQKATQRRSDSESYRVLLRALTEREPDLREHLNGVAELAVAIGKRLGLDDQALEELRLAAELHDLGKLAIPDAILQKPGPLNTEEQEFIRQHTAIGQRILGGAASLKSVGDIVRSTHERWDGNGYIDGLAGDDIPQSARIITVCDAYAAMTADRPYRKATTSAAALAELDRCAGTQFDPSIVQEFRTMILERDAHPTDGVARHTSEPGARHAPAANA